jgi:S1-C subfamily serine protease
MQDLNLKKALGPHIGVRMLKRILGICVLFAILSINGCTSSTKIPVKSPSGLIKHMGDSTVALVITAKDGEVHPFCTGVWVGQDEILTANHCVEASARFLLGPDADENTPVDPVGTKVHYVIEREAESVGEEPTAIHLGYVRAVDIDHDLAVLRVKTSGMPSHDIATLPSELPAIGDHVFVVGQPRGLYWSYVEGTVSSYRNDVPNTGIEGPYLQINGTVWFGNSGGGAFDDSGHVIGIASRLVRVPNMSLFVHANSIKKFLHEFHAPAEDLSKK